MNVVSRAICLFSLSSTSLLAQPWNGTFTKGSPAASLSKNGVGVGPYAGTLNVPGAPAGILPDITTANSGFSFWCVDGKGTFQTDNTIKLHTIASLAAGDLKTKLSMAAYVTTLYQGFGGPNTAANVSNFNAAIWSIMGYTPAGFSAGDAGTVTGYVNAAASNYTDLDLTSFYYVQFDGDLYKKGYAQELIFQGAGEPFITVPEPGTFALLSVGLIGIAAVRRRRATA